MDLKRHNRLGNEEGLWDDVEEYVRDLMHSTEVLQEFVREAAVSTELSSSPLGFGTTVSRVAVSLERRQNLLAEDTRLESERTEMLISDFPDVLNQDIDEIKERYIVGKIVGRDIADSSGNLVARQGERITRHTIRLAEESGRLVDLIEYMNFDTFED